MEQAKSTVFVKQPTHYKHLALCPAGPRPHDQEMTHERSKQIVSVHHSILPKNEAGKVLKLTGGGSRSCQVGNPKMCTFH